MTGHVALVIPWYGKDQPGGAERQAREVAMRLAARGHRVEIFTTCSRSFQSSWGDDFFPVGSDTDGTILIHRFPVDKRRARGFDAVNQCLLDMNPAGLLPGVPPLSERDEDVFLTENINSAALLASLKQRAEEFDAILFTPYLYGTTLNGLPQVAANSFLVPCLHNEAYAYLPACERTFKLARGLLYLSEGERLLAERIYGPAIATKGVVIGSGVELLGQNIDRQVTQQPPVPTPYILVLGRRDATKNTDLVVEAYRRFRQRADRSALRLVLAGPGEVAYSERDAGIHDLGLVEEATKRALLRASTALFQPSKNESYSRVMMEAWAFGKPVVVHGDCDATAFAVINSQGGFLARTLDDWVGAFERIDTMSAEVRAEMGRRGRKFAHTMADWERVIDRYETTLHLDKTTSGGHRPHPRPKVTAIHQVLPNMAYGDAVSDSALTLRDFLRRSGIKSDIFVQYIDKRVAHNARLFEAGVIGNGDGIIYHHSIGSALTPHVVAHNGPRVLIYHNITPPEFFEPYDPEFAQLLEDGLKELHRIAPSFEQAWGDSNFNTNELVKAGFRNVTELPLIVDPAKWAEPADATMVRALREDGRKNVLFVGRLAPNKCQHDLLKLASRLVRINPEVRLCIVGDGESDHPYVQYLMQQIDELALGGDVLVSGQVSQPVLQAFYRTADAYVSMSEHEGFGVPLIEAMWFDIPVIAFKSSAIPETLGDAAVMFTSKADIDSIAALVNVVLTDADVRQRICAEQRRNRERFTVRRLEPRYEQLVSEAFQ